MCDGMLGQGLDDEACGTDAARHGQERQIMQVIGVGALGEGSELCVDAGERARFPGVAQDVTRRPFADLKQIGPVTVEPVALGQDFGRFKNPGWTSAAIAVRVSRS